MLKNLLKEDGQSIVEVALIMPFFLLFFLILWQFLILFNAKFVLEHYSYELARSAATHNGGLSSSRPILTKLKRTLKLATGATALTPSVTVKKNNASLKVLVGSKIKLLPGVNGLAGIFKQNYVYITVSGLAIKEPYLGE